MLRATRMLLAPGVVKRTTGIVGLDVVPNAREVLIKLYEKTLNDIKIIPETAEYRKVVEKFTNYRLDVVKKTDDVEAIEKTISGGQVEELIEQAKSELQLIPAYASWRLWEVPRPSPNDDDFQDIYEELEYIQPESVEHAGLGNLARQKRAEAESRRKAANAAAAAAAAAPAPAAAAEKK